MLTTHCLHSSGWKNIFAVFQHAAEEKDQNIVDLAFTTMKYIFENYFAYVLLLFFSACLSMMRIFSLMSSSFIDAVNALTEFACNSAFKDVNFEAIRQLRFCASFVKLFIQISLVHFTISLLWASLIDDYIYLAE